MGATEVANLPQPQLVADFKAPGFYRYPGMRPTYDFVTDGDEVLPLEGGIDGIVLAGSREFVLGEFLVSRLSQTMADRVPVVGYGANLSPSILAGPSKFSKNLLSSDRIVPVLYGKIEGWAAAWSGQLNKRGKLYAQITPSDDVVAHIGVTMLSKRQLEMMHSSEQAYDLIDAVPIKLDSGEEVDGLMYARRDWLPLHVDGQPALLATIEHTGLDQAPRLTSAQAHAAMLRQLGENATLEEYEQLMTGLEPEERLAVVDDFNTRLAANNDTVGGPIPNKIASNTERGHRAARLVARLLGFEPESVAANQNAWLRQNY